ncbi:GntR family transcriptional regulator [Roseomonas sp. GC11]|uniref:GntR family transcriptional regulator n=1 Tax=Roseomonas sp. GC11 TaxID=2950546 RepID=UPI00210C5F3B|nr:GntR family transcriptional regulator [Roseomonas sp. GC11]MCQ4158662.1 GntR family transcriptional regulator [Roseomonas sp. GC11]
MEDSSVGEAAYRRIRADIVFGRLAPGQRLGLDWMRETYGTSISTLRELLNRLASEELVVAEGQRGFEVAPVSTAEFQEVAALRLLLEAHALEHAFAAGGLDWEGGVVSAHHKLAALERSLLAGEAADAALWKRYDWEFHHALIAACGSRTLLRAHMAAYDRYLRYQMVAVVFRGEVAAAEHRRLLEAALARDATTARAVLRAHIDGCVAQVLAAGGLDAFTTPPPSRAGQAAGKGAAPRARAARRAG